MEHNKLNLSNLFALRKLSDWSKWCFICDDYNDSPMGYEINLFGKKHFVLKTHEVDEKILEHLPVCRDCHKIFIDKGYEYHFLNERIKKFHEKNKRS